MDLHDDPQDKAFEGFLQQFQPRRPRPLKRPLMTPGRMAIAAGIVIAFAIPARLAWRETAPPVSPAESTVGGDASLPAAIAPQPTAPAPAAAAADTPPAAGPERRVPAPARSESASAPAIGGLPQLNRVPAPATPESANPPAVARLPQSNAPALNGRVRVGGDVKAPIRTFDVPPIYPEEAQAARAEGVVILQITIGEDGSVRDAVVLRSVPELDQAAINAALQWQYEPTLLNGQPVEVEMTVTFNFTLR